MLRPIRMGLVVARGDFAAFQRAIELATSSWGGQGFPIFEAGINDQATLSLAAALGVDCLFPVGDDSASTGLASTPGFRWTPSFDRLSPFNRATDTHGEHLLPACALYDWYRSHRLASTPTYAVTWPNHHTLNWLLWTWFGGFGQDEHQQTDARIFDSFAQPLQLGPGLPLPPSPMSIADQLTVTLQDVFHRSRWFRHGIVEIDPSNLADLILFWNLRAAGHDVFPWIDVEAEILAPQLSAWLEELAQRTNASTEHPTELSLWLSDPSRPAAVLQPFVNAGPWRVLLDAHRIDLHSCGPLFTTHERRYTVEADPASGDVSIPAPSLDFLPRRSSWRDLGMVAADIDVWTESNLGDTGRITIPAARCLAPHLRDRWSINLLPFGRPRARGRVVAMKVSDESARLTLIGAELLAHGLAKDAGFDLAVSENGRRLYHRIRLFGGVTEESLANQPAVRAVVQDALRSPYGVNVRALWNVARQHEDGWGEHMWHVRRRFRDYPAAVVGTLANLGILQPLANIECQTCGSAIRVAPAELSDSIQCELCSATTPFSTYLANNPERPATWDMRAMPALDGRHFTEMIPVMATLSVFAALFELGHSNIAPLNVVGVELKRVQLQCELDFMVLLQDAELPAVIIGESKAGHPVNPAAHDLLSQDDLDHFAEVQNSIRALGIDCWIAFSTTRPTLQTSEIDLLRHACDRSLMPVFDFRGQLLPMLPIVFTGEDLSVPAMDDRHPARRVHNSFPRLPELGRDCCRRHLGLVDVQYGQNADGQWEARPTW
jgi:hypothetical protein